MAFSSAERERRDRTMQRIMEVKGLKALILFGEVNVGNELYGDLRYYVDNKNVANRQVAMLFPAMQPVLFVGSPIQQQAASRRSSIKDCRSSDNMPADIVSLLKERQRAGRQGWCPLRCASRKMVQLSQERTSRDRVGRNTRRDR